MNKIKMIDKKTKSNFITYGMVIIAYLILQGLITSESISATLNGLLIPLCYYVILAVSLNLTVGILGELSLGHAGFMCVGAFTSAFFSRVTKDLITSGLLRFMLAILIGAAFAAIFGIIISLSVTRLSGDYLAIVTLAFGEIIKNVINALYVGSDGSGFHFSLKDVAGLGLNTDGKVLVQGAMGITKIPRDSTFVFGIILVLITLVIVLNLIHSRAGRAIMAVRDNRIAAESVGINIKKYRVMAFSISASLAGVAGVLYAHSMSQITASPDKFGYNASIAILVFVVLGGIGKVRGSMIAAIILTMLPEYLRFLRDYRMLIYAIVLIVMMIFNWSPKIIEWRSTHSLKRYIGGLTKKKQEETR